MKSNEHYIPLQIPPFDDINISKEEMIQCKNLFEEIAILMSDRCGIFDIHIAYYVICKLKENVTESMRINLELVREEMKIRMEKDYGK